MYLNSASCGLDTTAIYPVTPLAGKLRVSAIDALTGAAVQSSQVRDPASVRRIRARATERVRDYRLGLQQATDVPAICAASVQPYHLALHHDVVVRLDVH